MESHASIVRRSLEANDLLNAAFASVSPLATEFTDIEQSQLSAQLKRVAEIISVRTRLGVKRQVFFVGLGGFDSHSNLNNSHPALLSELDTALQEFYNATFELGVNDKVTTFTGSDFGRSLTNNGDGSDHGWGGDQIIMGDAISGGRFYGTPADITDGSSQMLRTRRLIPTTAIEQMEPEMADWFGASTGRPCRYIPSPRSL